MERYSSSDSNISLDSLEGKYKKKPTMKKKISDESADTILVPFYEKDVLIKVPKNKKSKNINQTRKTKIESKLKKDAPTLKNYLVNKDGQKNKHTSYLEMFRKQFAPAQAETKQTDNEVRSISPEFGDTERESFREEVSNPATDFFNTESYNEMYYDKLINQEINNFLEQAYAEQVKFTDDLRNTSPENIDDNHLRSVSDVSQPRRNTRRATIQPIQSIKLGGLGPDMENIRPRLERARSLQRYSEKVRMENRVKIYKKSVQEEIDKKAEKDLSAKRLESAKSKEQKGNENSFLINKTTPEKSSQMTRRIFNSKSKSANVKQTRHIDETNDKSGIENNYHNRNVEKNITFKKVHTKVNAVTKEKIKSCDSNRNDTEPVINRINVDVPVPPVHISFLVNMGGIRPSSALRTLEAKHRMYQEKVKAFDMKNNNEDVSENNK